MPFSIVRNDIVNMQSDDIVNSANPRPIAGLGTDSRIHEKAGPKLLKARQKIGDIMPGDAAITAAYALNAKYVIHTVGPVWQGGSCGEEQLLRSCYEKSLQLAKKKRCKSIVFPLIATNNYGFPRDKALQIAVSAFSAFLMDHDMDITLVVFDREAYRMSEKLTASVKSYIDQHYVDAIEHQLYGGNQQSHMRSRMAADRGVFKHREMPACGQQMAIPKAASLEQLLEKTDAGFTETLLKRIDETGKKDSQIYKKANLSKQHFSKIRNNPDYKPTKATALALAVALELDVEQTKDLIGRAGYALTNASKFDLIVRYYIENKNYDLMQINMTLFEFDQTLLGT